MIKCYLVVDKATGRVKGTQCVRSKTDKPAPVAADVNYIEVPDSVMREADQKIAEASAESGTVKRQGETLIKEVPTDLIKLDCEKSVLTPGETATITVSSGSKDQQTITVNGQTVRFTGSTQVTISYG